jgi:hypothetical protein
MYSEHTPTGLVVRFLGEGSTPSHTKVKESFEAFAAIRSWDVTAVGEIGSAGMRRFHGVCVCVYICIYVGMYIL